MELKSACGCTILLTTEELDQLMETDGKSLGDIVLKHIMNTHGDTSSISLDSLQKLGKVVAGQKDIPEHEGI